MKTPSNIPVYVVANFEIEDAETYRSYEKGFFRILRKHGGLFITYDDETVIGTMILAIKPFLSIVE
jgi:uncharacterized protein (DUF1330 family)